METDIHSHTATGSNTVTGSNNRLELLSISGPDAATFTQSQFSSDVKALAIGQGHWSAWLNPQGRVIAFFPLFRVAEHEWIAAIAFGRAQELKDRLQRFVFRSKVVLTLPTNRILCVGDEASADASASLPGPAPSQRVYWLTAAASEPERPDQDLPDLEMLREGLPFLDRSVSETFVAHALGLKRLQAISVNKGCYPGQEIVARTHFLGRNKRALCLVTGTSGAEVGGSLNAPGSQQVVGEIACVSGDEALAVIHSPELGMELHNLHEVRPVLTRIFADS